MTENPFNLTTEQQGLMDHADKYARERMYPLAQKMDDEEYWPVDIMREMGGLGFLGTTVPAEYGGAGMTLMDTGIMLQAFSRWNHALALSWVVHDNLCTNNFYNNASEVLRKKYLPKLCSGELIGCLGLTEPGAGSDALGSMRTRAVADRDDFVLNGSKLYITNGPIADVCLLYAKTDMNAGSKGITAFLIETNTPGFSVAQKLVKMGFRGSQTAELVLEDVRVPRENVVGEVNQGHKVVMSGLDFERALIAPISVGIAERALELAIDYAKTRVQFGKPIASFQMVQAHIADMYVWVETMKTFASKVLAEVSSVDETQAGRGSIHALTAASVMYCADMCNKVLNSAVQVHGGSGYIWESEINRLFRSIKLLEIGAGTTEVRKMIIAGELLR
ncbi:MAG: acyl-CoA dehydrogenase family protein [Spongiibacteraceae bacterium]